MKLLSLLALILICSSSYALEVPRLTSPVIDQAGLLSPKAKEALINSLQGVKATSGSEIAVLTVKSLEGESIEGYSIRVVDEWKLGSKEKDNGVLFLISLDDRLMRIEVGQGHEGDLPDATAGRIISGVKTYFKRGDYQSGIIVGVDLIAKSIGVDLQNLPKISHKRSRKGNSGFFLMIFIFTMFIFGRGGRGGGLMGALVYGGALGAGSALGRGRSGMGSGRSSGGSFGGGSFGGGGGFSGGGASGGW